MPMLLLNQLLYCVANLLMLYISDKSINRAIQNGHIDFRSEEAQDNIVQSP